MARVPCSSSRETSTWAKALSPSAAGGARPERRGEPTHPRLVLQRRLVGETVQQRQLERVLRIAAVHQSLEVVAEALHLLEEMREARAGERGGRGGRGPAPRGLRARRPPAAPGGAH